MNELIEGIRNFVVIGAITFAMCIYLVRVLDRKN